LSKLGQFNAIIIIKESLEVRDVLLGTDMFCLTQLFRSLRPMPKSDDDSKHAGDQADSTRDLRERTNAERIS